MSFHGAMCPWGEMSVGRKVLTPFSRPFRLILDSPDFSAKYTNWYVSEVTLPYDSTHAMTLRLPLCGDNSLPKLMF